MQIGREQNGGYVKYYKYDEEREIDSGIAEVT